jgi:hypothetical protein
MDKLLLRSGLCSEEPMVMSSLEVTGVRAMALEASMLFLRSTSLSFSCTPSSAIGLGRASGTGMIGKVAPDVSLIGLGCLDDLAASAASARIFSSLYRL